MAKPKYSWDYVYNSTVMVLAHPQMKDSVSIPGARIDETWIDGFEFSPDYELSENIEILTKQESCLLDNVISIENLAQAVHKHLVPFYREEGLEIPSLKSVTEAVGADFGGEVGLGFKSVVIPEKLRKPTIWEQFSGPPNEENEVLKRTRVDVVLTPSGDKYLFSGKKERGKERDRWRTLQLLMKLKGGIHDPLVTASHISDILLAYVDDLFEDLGEEEDEEFSVDEEDAVAAVGVLFSKSYIRFEKVATLESGPMTDLDTRSLRLVRSGKL